MPASEPPSPQHPLPAAIERLAMIVKIKGYTSIRQLVKPSPVFTEILYLQRFLTSIVYTIIIIA